MPTDHQAQVDELMAEYRRSREQLVSVQRSLVSIRESASSDDGLVTATVGTQGVLAELTIADGAYRRHQPAELAKLIVHAAKEAAGKAAIRAQEALVPVLPPDVDPEALLAGRADLRQDEIAAEAPGVDQVASAAQHGKHANHEESFEHRSWLDGRTA